MLHIIFLILKIIVFLVLGIIALVLLLTAAILLSPLVYRLDLSAEDGIESINGRVRFYWLMHLIAGEVVYRNGTLVWHFRAAWKKFSSEAENDSVPPGNAETDDAVIKDTTIHDENTAVHESVLPDLQEEIPIQPEPHTEEDSAVPDKPRDEIPDNKAHYKSPPKPQKNMRQERKKAGQVNKAPNLYERFVKFLDKIKYTFRKICDKIRALGKKKDRISVFLKNETHQNAFSRTVRELKRLLTFLKPSKASVDLEFGFSNPALTGYTLAGISMIYPVIGEFAQINPDFEHKVFKCNCFVKGNIRLIYGLIIALNMLLDKNVRITYRHIRKFRL